MACGLQNAVTTGYRDAVIGTTRVTGMVTDLESFSGYSGVGQPVE
jgi:hypothetical protein